MKEKLTRNIGLKLISIALAVVFWFVINSFIDPVTTTTIADIPVQVLNLEAMDSANKLIEVTSGEKITVKVRAKRSVANSLSVKDFEAIADVTNKNEFDAVPIIVSCKTYSAADIDILSHATEDGSTMLHLSLVELTSRSFGVAVITDGNVKDGYYIVNSSVSPNLITIKGSETQLAKVARVAVIISVDGATGTLVQSCPVQAYDSDGNSVVSDNLEFSELQVKIAMEILPSKEVEVVINSKGTPAENYYLSEFDYAPHYITVAGSQLNLAKVSRIALDFNISDASEDMETTLDIAAAIKDLYGDDITIVNENKKISVRAVIREMAARTVTLPSDRIEIRKLPDGMTCDLVNENIDITFRGLESDLRSLLTSDITAYIDCSYMTKEGTFSAVPVTIETKSGIRSENVSVDVVIRKTDGGEEDEPSV